MRLQQTTAPFRPRQQGPFILLSTSLETPRYSHDMTLLKDIQPYPPLRGAMMHKNWQVFTTGTRDHVYYHLQFTSPRIDRRRCCNVKKQYGHESTRETKVGITRQTKMSSIEIISLALLLRTSNKDTLLVRGYVQSSMWLVLRRLQVTNQITRSLMQQRHIESLKDGRL